MAHPQICSSWQQDTACAGKFMYMPSCVIVWVPWKVVAWVQGWVCSCGNPCWQRWLHIIRVALEPHMESDSVPFWCPSILWVHMRIDLNSAETCWRNLCIQKTWECVATFLRHVVILPEILVCPAEEGYLTRDLADADCPTLLKS